MSVVSEQLNMGLKLITVNLGRSLFEPDTAPLDEVESYVAALELVEALGIPDEMIIHKDGSGEEFALIYKDIEGEQFFAPLEGFSVIRGDPGHEMLLSLLDVLEADDDESLLTTSTPNGVYRLNLLTGELSLTKSLPESDETESPSMGSDAKGDGDTLVTGLDLPEGFQNVKTFQAEMDVAFEDVRELSEQEVSTLEDDGDVTEEEMADILKEAEDHPDEVFEKSVRKVSGGKVVSVKVKTGKKKKLSPKQKAALAKARKKGQSSSAKKKRAKSRAVGRRAGLEDDNVSDLVEEILQTEGDLTDTMEQLVTVVRGGKVKRIRRKRRRRRKRLSGKQRAALKKARKKAQSSTAKRRRKRSIKVRRRRGL